MKKIKLLLISVMSAFCLVGCKAESEHIIIYDADNTNGLAVLCEHHLSNTQTIKFIHDTYTGNIYVMHFEKGGGYAGGGSLSPYYNAEGKIMKYTEFMQVHKH